MSLPACQQRVLDHMEGALRASEPHLASMYAIFAQLNASEPIGAETLARRRPRWLPPGSALYAIVLIPVMFASIIIGALLGGARSGGTCEVGYSVGGGGSPLVSRPSCPPAGRTAAGKATVRRTAAGKATGDKAAYVPGRTSCPGTPPASLYTTRTGSRRAFSPPARADATMAGSPRLC